MCIRDRFDNLNKAKEFINKSNLPIVVKADGLASGKGVFICESKGKAINAATEILSGKFKSSNNINTKYLSLI